MIVNIVILYAFYNFQFIHNNVSLYHLTVNTSSTCRKHPRIYLIAPSQPQPERQVVESPRPEKLPICTKELREN